MTDLPMDIPPPAPHAGTGQTCGKCIHAIRPHDYCPHWIYCDITPCNRTQFRIKKIKSRDKACNLFTQKGKE